MAVTGNEDAWQRTALISIESGTAALPVKMQYEALSETIDIDTGEREIDIINLLNNGQLPKHGSMGMCTLTLEGYPLQAGTSDLTGATRGTPKSGLAKGYWELFSTSGHIDTGQPLDLDISNTLTRYRVAILFTNEANTTGTASASSNVTPSITGTAATASDHAGKMLEMTSGTADGGYYMIVSHNGTSVYTLTTGDTPATDGVSNEDTYTIHPTASGALKLASKGKRFVMADCFCTSCKSSFTDGILKQTLVFKGKPFDATGAALIKKESNDGTVQLPALGTYVAGTTYWA